MSQCLLEQPLDFYEPDVLPATQPIMSKHYRKTQWFGHLLFHKHGSSTLQYQSTEGALEYNQSNISCGSKMMSIQFSLLHESRI